MQQRRDTSSIPFRLISAKSGLFLEWKQCARVRLPENLPFLLSDDLAWQLIDGLRRSTWVRPPSQKRVQFQSMGWPELEDMRICDMKRAWLHACRAWLGRDVFNLTLRIFIRKSSLVLGMRVKAAKKVLLARFQELPCLMPLLAFDCGMWRSLPNWQVVKGRMLALGLSRQAWRWLNAQNNAYIAKIDWAQLSQVAWVNCHAAIERKSLPVAWIDPQTAALRGFGGLTFWIRRNAENLRSPGGIQMLKCLRLALTRWQSTAQRESREELVSEEFPLIADWLISTLHDQRDDKNRIRRGWTYDTLITRQSHWHLIEFSMHEGRPDVFWPEILGGGRVSDAVDYLELNSLHALLREARRMHHCVPSYIERCMSGDVCLFHLQLKAPRLERATLELTKVGVNRWTVSQLKGPCNSPVSEKMWIAAGSILTKLNPEIIEQI